MASVDLGLTQDSAKIASIVFTVGAFSSTQVQLDTWTTYDGLYGSSTPPPLLTLVDQTRVLFNTATDSTNRTFILETGQSSGGFTYSGNSINAASHYDLNFISVSTFQWIPNRVWYIFVPAWTIIGTPMTLVKKYYR